MANATLQLIAALIAVDGRRVHGQVKLAGDTLGIDGVCAVPIILAREGWGPRDLACLTGRGRQAVVESAKSIGAFLGELRVGRTRIITSADRVAA